MVIGMTEEKKILQMAAAIIELCERRGWDDTLLPLACTLVAGSAIGTAASDAAQLQRMVTSMSGLLARHASDAHQFTDQRGDDGYATH